MQLTTFKNLKPNYQLLAVAGCVLLIGVGIAKNGPKAAQDLQSQELRNRRTTSATEEVSRQIATENAQKASKDAIERWNNGLILVFARGTNQTTTIVAGEPVADPVRPGVFLGDGTVVGGYVSGGLQTAIIRNGVASDLAFTGDRAVIEEVEARLRGEG